MSEQVKTDRRDREEIAELLTLQLQSIIWAALDQVPAELDGHRFPWSAVPNVTATAISNILAGVLATFERPVAIGHCDRLRRRVLAVSDAALETTHEPVH